METEEEESNPKNQIFLKIIVKVPSAVRELRSLIHQGVTVAGVKFSDKVWEANMAYALRFMIDKRIVGMGWVTLKGNSYQVIDEDSRM